MRSYFVDRTETRIRKAEQSDWGSIWRFYATIIEQGETIAHEEPPDERTARSYWLGSPDAHTVVATIDGEVVGSARISPNRPGRGSHVATATFLVAPERQGHGIGRALGAYSLEWAEATGYRSMQFNAVVSTNKAAIGLWKSLGFEIVGTVPEAFAHPSLGLVDLHVMFRPLGS